MDIKINISINFEDKDFYHTDFQENDKTYDSTLRIVKGEPTVGKIDLKRMKSHICKTFRRQCLR